MLWVYTKRGHQNPWRILMKLTIFRHRAAAILANTSGRWTIKIESSRYRCASGIPICIRQVTEHSVQVEMSVRSSWAIRHVRSTSALASLMDDFRSRQAENSPMLYEGPAHPHPRSFPNRLDPMKPLDDQTPHQCASHLRREESLDLFLGRGLYTYQWLDEVAHCTAFLHLDDFFNLIQINILKY